MAKISTGPDLVTLGKEVIADGKLQELRDRLGLSATMQAHLVGIQPVMLHSWEAGRSTPSPVSAEKVGSWYEEALDKLSEAGVDCQNLLHVSQASQYLGASYGTIRDWWERGMIECVDLGPLGLYVQRDQVPGMTDGSQR